MKKILKRTVSFLLAFVMVLAMVPAIDVFAVNLEGAFDEIACPAPGKLAFKGWGLDFDNLDKPVDIHLYIGGPAGTADAHGIALGAPNDHREDLNNFFGITGTHGYLTTVETFKSGLQDVYAYVVTESGNKYLGYKTVFIRPTEATYGDNGWTLQEHDDCAEKPDGIYRIISAANTNYSLDVTSGLLDDAVNVQLYTNLCTDAQLFHLRRIQGADVEGGTIVSFMNVKSQRFLDQDAGSTNVHQYGMLPENAYRRWEMRKNPDGTYSFQSLSRPGHYLTIEGTEEGTKIQDGANICVATSPNADGTPSLYQKFYLNAEYVYGDYRLGSLVGYLKTGEYFIWRSSSNGVIDSYVMDVSGADTAVGTNIQLWEVADDNILDGYGSALQQMFDIQRDNNGWYTIRNINSSLYVAVSEDPGSTTGYNVTQQYTTGDEAKWAFVPRVRSDNTHLSYWIVNKATGLYLFHNDTIYDFGAGWTLSSSNITVRSLTNGEEIDNSTLSWGMQVCTSTGEVNSIINNDTGIEAGQFDTSDTISLPIKIYDYPSDGMLFEYLSYPGDNAGFSLVGKSNNGYLSWPLGHTTFGKDRFYDETTFLTGNDALWAPYADNNVYVVNQSLMDDAQNGGMIDLSYLSELLGYSVFGYMTSGEAAMGLLDPTLREVDGYKLPEYNDEVVVYLADLLDKTLDSSAQISKQEAILPEGHTDDISALLLEHLKVYYGGILPHHATDVEVRRAQLLECVQGTYEKKDKLIGTWNECKNYITCYTDAAYFLLNNLFYPGSYNMPQDTFDYLVLSKATLSNGKTAYVFDSDFSDTYVYVPGFTQNAVEYDFTSKTISNTNMMGKPGYRFLFTSGSSPYYSFLPVWKSDGTQNSTINPYGGELGIYGDNNGNKGHNYNYVMQCNGMFIYTEHEDLFFDFVGDDDVFLFINGQLVLELGGAHSPAALKINVNDYVYAARAAVAAGTATDRDRALALIDGEEYSFDFYYMERHSPGANIRIATNMRVSDIHMDTEKKAYQNGQVLNNGGIVNADDHVEYSFKLSNPEDSYSNLYRLTFNDAKLGVSLDYLDGLTVTGNKTLNSNGTALTAADLKIYYTNQMGVTQEVVLAGSTAEEKNTALKSYLEEVNGHGLLVGCSIEIRGIYYNIENSDFDSGRFVNTLHATANQMADGSGDTYQDSVNMVVCVAAGPQYYQWSGQNLNITADKFMADVNELLTENSPLLEQIAPATSLGTLTNLQLCDMKGNVIHSSNVTAFADGLVINYSKPGAYLFYVKATQSDNSAVIISVQVYVVEVQDNAVVLDYGLKVNLMDVLASQDTLYVPGKTTSYVIEALTTTEPSYGNNQVSITDGTQRVDGTYGTFILGDNGIEYHPDQFMDGADSVYVSIRVGEDGAAGSDAAPEGNVEAVTVDSTMLVSQSTTYAATAGKLYLKPNTEWFTDGARFAAYFFGNGETWASMTDSNGDGVYECAVPSGCTSVIFCRMNPNNTTNNWNNKWNQSNDLTIPTNGNNCYTIAAGTWDKGGGSWSQYYYSLVGFINGADYGCEGDDKNPGQYKFVNGKLVATFTEDSYVFVKTTDNANWYMTEAYADVSPATLVKGGTQKLFVPGNVEVTFTLVENANGSVTLSYEIPKVYSLIGNINGADYGFRDDYVNRGQYRFVDGKLVATFTEDSYVFVKTIDNKNWYMAKNYVTGKTANLYNTAITEDSIEKLFVPGNMEITFTLVENADGSITLSYVPKVDINREVQMYKKISVIPANVVYYEDDFPAITYNGNGNGASENTFTVIGTGSGERYQSGDQSLPYGYDDVYQIGTEQSGDSGHVIKILDTNIAAEFTFTGTGFELIGRCLAADECVIYLDVLNSKGSLLKRLPVILEYDDIDVANGNEGIYQVPIVRVDDLAHDTYTVQIHGIPVYVQDSTGAYVIDKVNPPTLFIDGVRIYNPLSMDDSNRDHYLDGEDTAQFLEIRDLVLDGKAAVVGFDKENYSITTGTSIFVENRTGISYPINSFILRSVAYTGYFADADADDMVLRTESNQLGNRQFEFTFAKTEDETDYFYIHNGTDLYLKKNAEDDSVMLVHADPTSEDSFLWSISYQSVEAGIATICNKADGSYLSAASVDTTEKTGQILAVATETITDAQKWELVAGRAASVFEGNGVTSVNDYLAFGPNNELYLDGETTNQALVVYFTPDSDPATTTMLQVGVHVLNDNRLFGEEGELSNPGILYQGANTGTVGFKVLDDDIRSATERYYPIDLSICKYDEVNNRYEVVLYCKGGYLSFTNLKVSGGTICTVNGQVADLRYNNGVLQMLTTVGVSGTETWVTVSDPQNYVDFASLAKQMSATVIYTADADTGEFVPDLPTEDEVKPIARTLLFEDIIKMRFYFDISGTGITTATGENSGLLVWTEEQYAASDLHTVNTAGQKIRGLNYSANGYYADTDGIPAKNMIDRLYVRAYVIRPDGSCSYSRVIEYSPVMYAQNIVAKDTYSEAMKELVVALMNYGAAAQVYFGYKTDTMMNDWLTEEQRSYVWSDDLIEALPQDTSKYAFTTDSRIARYASTVSFNGALNQNFYFRIPDELLEGAVNVELLYWTEKDYNALPELTVDNARKATFNVTEKRGVIEGIAAKALGDGVYYAIHIVYEDGESFSRIGVDSTQDYTRRIIANNNQTDAMKELARTLVIYSGKAKSLLGG